MLRDLQESTQNVYILQSVYTLGTEIRKRGKTFQSSEELMRAENFQLSYQKV